MSYQVSTRVDEKTKLQFDTICDRIGISPSNALSVFIKAVINNNGLPFRPVVPSEEYRIPNDELRAAMEDVKSGRNLHGPYKTAEEAVASMLEG